MTSCQLRHMLTIAFIMTVYLIPEASVTPAELKNCQTDITLSRLSEKRSTYSDDVFLEIFNQALVERSDLVYSLQYSVNVTNTQPQTAQSIIYLIVYTSSSLSSSPSSTVDDNQPSDQQPSWPEQGDAIGCHRFVTSSASSHLTWTPFESKETSGCLSVMPVLEPGNSGDVIVYGMPVTLCPPPDSDCRHYKVGEWGWITSPGFPQRYPDNADCTFTIIGYPGASIDVQLQSIKIEPAYSGECVDYVTISAPDVSSQPLCGRYEDGDGLREQRYISEADHVRLQFHSDSKTSDAGFRLFYAVRDPEGCNVALTETSGSFSSPLYPSHYLPNTVCTYSIRLPPSYRVILTLVDFDLGLQQQQQQQEQHQQQSPCSGDYILITDLLSNTTTKLQCTHQHTFTPYQIMFESSSSAVDVQFVSDHRLQGKGFEFRYKGVPSCKNETLTGLSGTISSPNHPNNYPNNQKCFYQIRTSSDTSTGMTNSYSDNGMTLELKFISMFTESGPEGDSPLRDKLCSRDFVYITSGNTVHRVCGNWSGKEHIITFRDLTSPVTVSFVSDDQGTRSGFSMEWRTIPTDWSLQECLPEAVSTDKQHFEVIYGPLSWADAETDCRSRGGHLAKVGDLTTQQILTHRIDDVKNKCQYKNSFWIGANDLQWESDFYWISGGKTQFTNWFPGWTESRAAHRQPSDDGLSNEDCVEIRRQFHLPWKGTRDAGGYFWNDRDCGEENPYICGRFTNRSSTPSPQCNRHIHLNPSPPSLHGQDTNSSMGSNDGGLSNRPGEVILTSLQYPNNYGDFQNCSLTIVSTPGTGIMVEMDALWLEGPDDLGDCVYDSLGISPYLDPTTGDMVGHDPVCGDWTGREKELHHVIGQNSVTFTFATDHSRTFPGFQARAWLLDAPHFCGLDEWLFTSGRCVMVSSMAMSMEEAVSDCGSKMATVWTGLDQHFIRGWLNTSAGKEYESSSLLLWNPEESEISTNRCAALNVSVTSQQDYESGQVHVEKVLGLDCNDKHYYICHKSPLPYGSPPWRLHKSFITPANLSLAELFNTTGTHYENLAQVSISVNAPENHQILLSVSNLDIETQRHCSYDYLVISNSSLNEKLCGKTPENEIVYVVSSTNETTIHFKSDHSVAGRGVDITWSWVNLSQCRQEYFINTSSQFRVSSLNFPMPYPARINCSITIRSTDDISTLALTFDTIRPLDFIDEVKVVLDEEEGSSNPTVSYTLNASLYSDSLRPVLVSNMGYLRLDYSNENGIGGMEGFKATIDGKSDTLTLPVALKELQEGDSTFVYSIGYPSQAPTGVLQDIVLRAPIGHNVEASLVEYDDHPSDVEDCSSKSIQLDDVSIADAQKTVSITEDKTGESFSAKSVGTWCGRPDVNSSVSSTLNRMRIRIRYGNSKSLRLRFVIFATVVKDANYLNKTREDFGLGFDSCQESPCLHDGVCKTSGDGWSTCDCQPRYGGMFCQEPWCSLSPCLQGWCNMTSWGFLCICQGDFYGPRCDLDLWECARHFCNGHGRCRPGNQTHPTCKCTEGWTGVMCANRVEEGEESLSLGQRLLKEPIWIGLIVILSVLLMFGVTYVIRRRCGKYFSCCDIKKPRINDNILNADGTIALNSFPLRGRMSRPSCVSLPKSTVSASYVGTHTVVIKTDTDSDADALTPTPTPSGQNNGEAAARFFASYKNADKNPIAPPLTTDFTRTTDTSLSQEVDDASVGAMVGGRLLFDLHIRENKAKAKEESTALERTTSLVNLPSRPEHSKMDRMKKRYSHNTGPHLVRQEAQFDEFSVSGAGSSPHTIKKNLSVGSTPHHIFPHVIVEKCNPSSPANEGKRRVNINDIEEELSLREIKITVPVSPRNNENVSRGFTDSSGARVIEVSLDGESEGQDTITQKTPSPDALSVQTLPSLSSRPSHVKGHKRVVSLGDEETLSREIEKLIKYRKFIKEWKSRTKNSYSIASSSMSMTDQFEGQGDVITAQSLDSDRRKKHFKYFKKRNRTLDYPLRHNGTADEVGAVYVGDVRRKREKYSKKLQHSSHSLDEGQFIKSHDFNSKIHHNYDNNHIKNSQHHHHNHSHSHRHDGYRTRKHSSYHSSWDIPEFPDIKSGEDGETYSQFNQRYEWNSALNGHGRDVGLVGNGYWSHSKRGNLTTSTSDLTYWPNGRLEAMGYPRPTSRQSTLTHKHRKSKRSRHSSTRSTRSQSHYPRIHESSSESDILLMANRINPYLPHPRLPHSKGLGLTDALHEPAKSKPKYKSKVKTQMAHPGITKNYDSSRNSSSLPDISQVDRATDMFSSVFSQEIEIDDFSPVEDNIDFDTLRPNGKSRDTLLTTSSWPYLRNNDKIYPQSNHSSSKQYLSVTDPSDASHPHTDSEIDYKSKHIQTIHEKNEQEHLHPTRNTRLDAPSSKQGGQRLDNNVLNKSTPSCDNSNSNSTHSCKVIVYNSHGKVSETARSAIANTRHLLTRKHSSLDLMEHTHSNTINPAAIRPAASLQDLSSMGVNEHQIVKTQPTSDRLGSLNSFTSNTPPPPSRSNFDNQRPKRIHTPFNSLSTGAECASEENTIVNGEISDKNDNALNSAYNSHHPTTQRHSGIESRFDQDDKQRDTGLYLSVTDTDSAMSSAPSHNSTPTGAKAMAEGIEQLYSYESKVKDSAYETKQSSLEAEAYLESKGIKSKAPVRTEDRRVTQRLTQAAVKLFIMQQRVRKSRQQLSLDSSIHTISEDDPSLDDIIVTNAKTWAFKPGVLYPANSEGDESNPDLRPLHCDRILEEQDCRVEYEV